MNCPYLKYPDPDGHPQKPILMPDIVGKSDFAGLSSKAGLLAL